MLQKQDIPYTVVLSVCNVDRNPNAYVEAIHLANIVRTFTRHITSSSSTQTPSNETLEKEKDDYVYCLRTTVALRRPRYVLLVEDDALPNAHMTTVLGHVLQTRLNRKYARGEFWDSDDDIAYVKFYHPDWLLGYGSFDANRLPCLLAFGAVASSLVLAVVRCISSSLVRERDVYVTWTLLAVYAMMVAVAIGRSNIVHVMRMFPPHLYRLVEVGSRKTLNAPRSDIHVGQVQLICPAEIVSLAQKLRYYISVTCDNLFVYLSFNYELPEKN